MAVVEASFLACEKATSRELIFDLDRCESRGKQRKMKFTRGRALIMTIHSKLREL